MKEGKDCYATEEVALVKEIVHETHGLLYCGWAICSKKCNNVAYLLADVSSHSHEALWLEEVSVVVSNCLLKEMLHVKIS